MIVVLWIANGRFDRFVACSRAEPFSGTAHDLIGTLPGLRTQGRVADPMSVTAVIGCFGFVDMAAGPPATVLVAASSRLVMDGT